MLLSREKCRDFFKKHLIFEKSLDFYEDNILVKASITKPMYMNKLERVDASVWKGQLPNGEFIAVKQYIAHDIDDLKVYFKEIDFLKSLSGVSKNFLNFYGYDIHQKHVVDLRKWVLTIQMEYAGKNLKAHKSKRIREKKPYNDLEILLIYKQLILALNQMRQLNILHRDIKPSNIMIDKDFTIKIIDFNSATFIRDNDTSSAEFIGTLNFMAPEVRTRGIKSGDKGDVYSLGMTLLYILTEEPLVGLNLLENQEKLRKIIGSITYPWLLELVSRMLEYHFDKRPDLKNLISYIPEHDTSITEEV